MVIDPKFWTKLNELAAVYSARIIGALALIVVGFWLVRRISTVIRNVLEKTHLDITVVSFIANLCRIGLIAVVIIVGLNVVGVPVTSVVALLGTAGLAVALALKDSLNNVAAGLSLLILRPFKVGNYIEVGSIGGNVEEIGLFHSTLNTPDNRQIHMPNSSLLANSIINFSANETRRIDLVVGISYESDLRKAKEILESLLEDERILKEPEPLIKVGELAESSVNIFFRPWVDTPNYWPVRYALTEQIKMRFDAEGIVIPYPQRQLHLTQPLDFMPSES